MSACVNAVKNILNMCVSIDAIVPRYGLCNSAEVKE